MENETLFDNEFRWLHTIRILYYGPFYNSANLKLATCFKMGQPSLIYINFAHPVLK